MHDLDGVVKCVLEHFLALSQKSTLFCQYLELGIPTLSCPLIAVHKLSGLLAQYLDLFVEKAPLCGRVIEREVGLSAHHVVCRINTRTKGYACRRMALPRRCWIFTTLHVRARCFIARCLVLSMQELDLILQCFYLFRSKSVHPGLQFLKQLSELLHSLISLIN